MFQHRALAGAVVSDHPDRFTLLYLQADVAQRPELAISAQPLRRFAPHHAPEHVRQEVAQRIEPFALAEALGYVIETDRDVGHRLVRVRAYTLSANVGSSR